MKSVISQAQKLVVPSKNQREQKTKIANRVLELVQKQISKYPEIKNVEFGGSYPKDTWLPEKADIDILILFDKNTSLKKFENITLELGFEALKKFKPYVKYSEHPYVEAVVQKTKINIVPCYMVERGQWQSPADRTRFHTGFMIEKLTKDTRNQVRVLKQFFKNNNIYGAEIAKQGFSGYVAEVLIYRYGSFSNVIKQIGKIKSDQVIGVSGKKFDTVIKIIDPIDDRRNLAAAISNENIGKFILLCRMFEKNPSISFFKSRKANKKMADLKLLENCLAIKFTYSKRSPDIIWGQIKKASNVITTQLELGGFKIIKNDATTDEDGVGILLFFVESLQISLYHLKEGPDFFNESDVARFISKNNIKKSKTLWIRKDKKIVSLERRLDNNIQKFLKKLLSTDLEKSGIPGGIKPDIKKGFRIYASKKDILSNKSIKIAMEDFISTDATIFSSN